MKVVLLSLTLALAACMGLETTSSLETKTAAQPLMTEQQMLKPQENFAGKARTVTPTGTIDTSNPFFLPGGGVAGNNGRSCGTCHQADQGWTINPKQIKELFDDSDGLDPLFQFDGLNCPTADVSTRNARKLSTSIIREKGLIRLAFPVPATAEFVTDAVDDPNNCAVLGGPVSIYRRPIPTNNLGFLTIVNWEGRSTSNAIAGGVAATNVRQMLLNQSNGATVAHAFNGGTLVPGVTLPVATREIIVDFELTLLAAQEKHENAGKLDKHGATGGPEALLTQPFVNGATSPGTTFNLYDAWLGDNDNDRSKVAAGQTIFNTRPLNASGATCAGCHGLPNIGGQSSALNAAGELRTFDVGVSNAARRTADQPLYTFRHKVTGELKQTTDPGRALFSGRWDDIGKFKAPSLRNLSARAPYFHDGSAKKLDDVVDHYLAFFPGLNLDTQGRRSLVMFLESL